MSTCAFVSASPNLFSAPLSSRRRRRQPPPIPRSAPRITCSLSPPPASGEDPFTSLGRLLWGPSLPPSLLVSAARTAWSATWHLMMRQLAPSSASGSYSRPASQFPTVPKPYHTSPRPNALRLYAARACPWAHRALIALALSGLDIPVSIASPGPDGAWLVPAEGSKTTTLKEVYGRQRGGYSGRATVPMLWDGERQEVVCNESYAIAEFFNSAAARNNNAAPDLAPEELTAEIQKWNDIVYPNVNNGVYRCGFAQSQEAYDAAASDLFGALDALERHLSTSRYLCGGDTPTLADVCLFTTLIRFDLVYNVLFKCTKKKLVEYPNLYGFTRDVYQIPMVAETCDFEAIADGYYRILFPLNPGGIRPVMPSASEHKRLSRPHHREALNSGSMQPQLHAS